MNTYQAATLFLLGVAFGWIATHWYRRGPRGG
jgi:hypothetical protein